MRRTRPRGVIRRAQILDAATQVFLENGYGGATIDLVVARAGASKATIYSFFGGKEGLFAAIVEERCERILSAFVEVEVTDADAPSVLADIGRRYLEAFMAPDALRLYRLIIAEGGRFPDLAQTVHRVGSDRIIAHLAGVLADWRERGLIVIDDPDLAAAQFLDAVRGELLLRALAGVVPEDLAAAIHRRVENAVQMVWNGIKPTARTP